MDNKKLSFSVDAGDIDIKQLLQKDFLELSIKAISSANPNRNNSWFTRESMERSKHTFANKPILGYFENDDFVSHNGTWDHDDETGLDYWNTLGRQGERILGVIRDNDSIEIVEDKNGLSWIKVSCVLWVEYNFKQVKRLLKDAKKAKARGGLAKNVSVEVDITDYTMLPNGVMQINEFNLAGITILGSRNGVKVEPGIEDAGLSIIDIMGREVFEKQSKAVRLAYEKLDSMAEQNKEDLSKMEVNQEKTVFEEEVQTEETETVENDVLLEDEKPAEEVKVAEQFEENDHVENDDDDKDEPCDCGAEQTEEEEIKESECEVPVCDETSEECPLDCQKEECVCSDCGETEEARVEEAPEEKKEDECKYAELEAQYNELKEKYEALVQDYENIKSQLELQGDYEAVKEKVKAYEHKEFLGEASKLIASGNLKEDASKKLYEACDANEITDLENLKIKVALEVFEGNVLPKAEEAEIEVESPVGASLNMPISTPEIPEVFSETQTKKVKKSSWDILGEYVGK